MIDFVRKGKSTKDATATASDIIYPKTAYVNDEKIVGSIAPTYESIGTNIIVNNLGFVKTFSIRDNIIIAYNYSSKKFELYKYEENSLTLLNTVDCNAIASMPTSFNSNNYIDLGIEENNTRYACYTLANQTTDDGKIPIVMLKIQNNKFVNIKLSTIGSSNSFSAVTAVKVLFSNMHYNLFAALANNNNSSCSMTCNLINNDLNVSSSIISVSPIEFSKHHFIKWNLDDTGLIMYGLYKGPGSTPTFRKYQPFRVEVNNNTINTFKKISGDFNYNGIHYPAVRDDFNYALFNEYGSQTKYNIFACVNNIPGNVMQIAPERTELIGKISLQGIPYVWKDNNILTIDTSTNTARLYKIEISPLSVELIDDISISPNSSWTSTTINSPYVFFLNKSEFVAIDINAKRITSINIQNQNLYNTSDANISATEVVSGKVAYGVNGKITGTMINNGQLNYTSSTSEQTIPAGYTNGGTIEAYPQSQEDYNQCLSLAQKILNGYEILDLLHLNSSKKLDLGIKVNPNNVYKLKFKDNSISSYEAYIGTSSIGTYICRNGASNNVSTSNITSNINNVPTIPTEVTLNFIAATNSNIWLGSTGGSDVANADYDFYYLEVYDNNNNLINKFVPAENSSNVEGLLDIVTNDFVEY